MQEVVRNTVQRKYQEQLISVTYTTKHTIQQLEIDMILNRKEKKNTSIALSNGVEVAHGLVVG